MQVRGTALRDRRAVTASSLHLVDTVDSREPQTDSSHTGNMPLVMISTALRVSYHSVDAIRSQLVLCKRTEANTLLTELDPTHIIERSSVTPKPSLSPAWLATMWINIHVQPFDRGCVYLDVKERSTKT